MAGFYEHVLGLLPQLEKPSGGTDYFELFTQYLLEVLEELTAEKLRQDFEHQTNNLELGRKIMTAADRLRQEGRGEEKFQIAKSMLQDGLSWKMIQKHTGLSKEKFQELSAKLENQVKSA